MSFQQGLSGLNASSKNLEVIGNNVANANTYGAKASRAEFSHLYTNSLGIVTQGNVGIGVRTDAVVQLFTQGGITDTGVPTDLAITGSGFFQVSDGINPTLYTRNGQFKVDANGSIVNNDGLSLMGYLTDAKGQILPGVAQPLKLPTSGLAPLPTTEISMELNLDSNAKVATTSAFSPTDPTSYNNATSQVVYDSKGQAVTLSYYFQKASADTWNVYATANGVPVDNDGGAPPLPAKTMQLKFSNNGQSLVSVTNAGGTPVLDADGKPLASLPITIPAATTSTGAATQSIPGVTLDFTKMTQVARAFSVTALEGDGNAPGALATVNIQEDGTVMAVYSNGKSVAAGQIELANFRNPQGLQPLAGNVWASTPEAGEAIKGTPNNGVLGKLQSGALEESNVDIGAELVNMITAQRAYQANAQTIKTQDQVMQTLVNLK